MQAAGAVFTADIETLGPLPESEIAETALFEALPPNITYPDITPIFLRTAARIALPSPGSPRDLSFEWDIYLKGS